MNSPKYSIVIPVYNRPDELRDLLESLAVQTRMDFEIIVVEDGSSITCQEVIDVYSKRLRIRYFYKSNSGPGPARNFGFAHAMGEYYVVFDSDCLVPSGYFDAVDRALETEGLDAWGGPDRGHESFTVPQRAMAYTMASILTTGGIRGGRHRMGWFQPRSFNMGISKKVFEATGGFHFDRFAEDIEFSIRMRKAGFRIGLIPDAFVFHRRRTSFLQFFRQVFNFGRGRALVGKVHPEEVRVTHWFPAGFTVGTLIMPVLLLVSKPLGIVAFALFGIYLLAIFLHSLITCRHAGVALLSIIAALLQLWGYGVGFLTERFKGGSPVGKAGA